jgi:hypothetical protein
MDISSKFILIAKRILRELKGLSKSVSAGFLGTQKQIETIAKEHQTANERPDPTPEMRSILDTLQGIEAEQSTGHHSQDRYQNRNLIVSVAGVLVLLGYTIVNYKILRAMRDANKTASDSFAKTLCQMQSQTRAQQTAADASKTAAGAALTQATTAQNSLKATIDNFHLDQRAWVGLGEYRIETISDREPFKLALPWVNSGKTPAIETEQAVAYIFSDTYLTGPPSHAYNFDHGSAIPPQGKYVTRITNRGVPEHFEAITGKKLWMYFFGKFRYHDIYGSKLHTTSFCLFYDSDSKEMVFCEKGNSMD